VLNAVDLFFWLLLMTKQCSHHTATLDREALFLDVFTSLYRTCFISLHLFVHMKNFTEQTVIKLVKSVTPNICEQITIIMEIYMKIYMHFCVHLKLNLRFRVKKFGMNIIEKNKTQFMPNAHYW